MKKIITCCMVMALGALSFMACHEDKGNYDYSDLVAFYVEQEEIPLDVTISQFQTLNLPSRLIYGGDKNNLEYLWAVVGEKREGLLGLDYSVIIDTLATTENLAAPVPTTPGSYTLAFAATERESRRSTLQVYNLTVESSAAIGAGLLVLYEKDGVADCDLIKTKSLVGSLQKDTVLRALYSRANPDHPLAGKPLQVGVNIVTSLFGNRFGFYLWTDADGVELSLTDMSVTRHFEELFFVAPGTAKPQGYCSVNANTESVINDGQYHFLSVLALLLGIEPDPLLASAPGDYYAAPYVLHPTTNTMVIYDQAGMRFCSTVEVVPISSTASGNAFDFGNVGKQLVYMEAGFGAGRSLAVFKNPVEDGKRYLYHMNLSAAAASGYVANAAYDVSAWPGIASAELFAFSTRGPIGFYATGNHVYRCTYDPNNFAVPPTAEEAWPYIPAGETVTALQLVKYAGVSVPSSALDRFLLIATYNETSGEGKIYMVEIDVVNGACAATPTAVYDNFGKVVHTVFKPM
jgi:hypothetical protein